MRGELSRPFGELATGFLHDPLADLHHQAALFEQRQEVVREEHPDVRRAGLCPPDERLEPDECARRERHDRLVVQEELVVLEGEVQSALVDARRVSRPLRLVVHDPRAGTGLVGLAEGLERVVHHVVERLVVVGAHRGTDVRTDAHRVGSERERRRHQLDEEPGRLLRALRVRDAREHHREHCALVAQHLGAGEVDGLQSGGRQTQELVARVGAVDVVDVAQLAHLDEREHCDRARALARSDGGFELSVEVTTGRDAGDVVDIEIFDRLVLDAAALADAAEHAVAGGLGGRSC